MVDRPLQESSRFLSFKLVCIIALAILMAAGLMSYNAYTQERRSELQRETADLKALSQDLATRIDLSLSSCKVLAAHLACTRDATEYLAQGGPRGEKQRACQDWLARQIRQSQALSAMLILSPTGDCLASTNGAFIGHNYAFRTYFKDAMAGRSTVSDWSVGLIFHQPHVDASAPVWIAGKVAGVLVAESPVDAMEKAIGSAGINGRTAMLIDRSGVALSHSDPAFQYHAIQPLDPQVEAQLSRTRQFMRRAIIVDPPTPELAEGFNRARTTSQAQTVTFRSRVAVLTPLVEKDWVVSVALPRGDGFLPMRKGMAVTLLVGLAATIVGGIAAFAMGKWLLWPVFQLADTMGRFGAGETSARAPVPNRDGRGRLSQAFNAMADSLQANQTSLDERTRELRRSEAQFRLLFEKAPIGMAIVESGSGRFLSVNPRLGEIVGYAPAELLDAEVQSLTHPEARMEVQASLTALAEGQVAEIERARRYLDRSGGTVWGRLRIVNLPVPPGDPPRHLALVEDITERLQAEEALALERRHLEERVQDALSDLRRKDQILASQSRLAAMGEMINNIAHQWRQPLNALGLLLVNLEDAHEYGDLDGPTLGRICAEAHRLIQGMSSTISDFRSFFRPDRAMEAFPVLEQVRAAVRMVEGSLAADGIQVEILSSDQIQLFGFPNEYSQVLLNLLGNAKEAILDRRVRPGRIAIRFWTEAGFCGLAIADNGGGIPPESLDRIFEPYFSTREMGTGIGLYMSKQIIEHSMGGRIRACNGPEGAEFTVLVPTSPEGGRGEWQPVPVPSEPLAQQGPVPPEVVLQ